MTAFQISLMFGLLGYIASVVTILLYRSHNP